MLVANHLPPGLSVTLQSENGMPGMVRGGHVDLTILGAMQVSERGDLANWMIPGKMVKGMGGAMDMVTGCKRVLILMEHLEKTGAPKLLRECSLPLTGYGVVDAVITDLAIFRFEGRGGPLRIVERAPGVSCDEIRAKTEANVATDELRTLIISCPDCLPVLLVIDGRISISPSRAVAGGQADVPPFSDAGSRLRKALPCRRTGE